MSRVLGLIAARGGSKRVPGKNIRPCAGKPLIAWTCEAARGSRRLDQVILSTDDPGIAEAARACGIEVPFLRPSELAADATPMLPVLQHAVDWASQNGEAPELVVLLQPTSPLRQSHHIDEAVDLLLRSRADTVVSITQVPPFASPSKLMVLSTDGSVRNWEKTESPPPGLCLRNGPAVLATRASVLRAGQLYGQTTLGYMMDRRSSIDIDDPFDFTLAELLLRQRLADEQPR